MAEDPEWEIPGRDDRHHADGFLQNNTQHVVPQRVVTVAVGRTRQGRRITPEVSRPADLAPRLGNRLSAFQRFLHRNALDVGLDQVSHTQQNRRAVFAGNTAPNTRIKGVARGSNGQLRLRDTTLGRRAHNHAMRR